jgi:hypothetical protein
MSYSSIGADSSTALDVAETADPTGLVGKGRKLYNLAKGLFGGASKTDADRKKKVDDFQAQVYPTLQQTTAETWASPLMKGAEYLMNSVAIAGYPKYRNLKAETTYWYRKVRDCIDNYNKRNSLTEMCGYIDLLFNDVPADTYKGKYWEKFLSVWAEFNNGVAEGTIDPETGGMINAETNPPTQAVWNASSKNWDTKPFTYAPAPPVTASGARQMESGGGGSPGGSLLTGAPGTPILKKPIVWIIGGVALLSIVGGVTVMFKKKKKSQVSNV